MSMLVVPAEEAAAPSLGDRSPAGRRPRLMLFTDSFVHGGTERQFVQAVRHLNRAKFDLLIGCLKRRGPFLADMERIGVPVFEFPCRSLRKWSAVRWVRRTARFLREQQVDLVHAFDFYTTVLCVPAARRAGVPVLASLRDVVRCDTLHLRLLLAAVCRRADAVVVNSQAAGAPLARRSASLASKIHLIHNSVDVTAFTDAAALRETLRKALFLSAETCAIGNLSALRQEKQVEMFLRAAARAAGQLPQAIFLVVGDGDERPRLEHMARKLSMGERMVFLGDRNDVPALLGALDILALSSKTESSPNAVLEAMAAGQPVVATRVGGVPELIEDGVTGYLVAPDDDAAMAARIIELARDPELRRRMGAAGRARAEREFTPQRMAQKLEDLYHQLLRARQPVARILQIGNYPPPVCGWSLHTQLLDRELTARGADSSVLDIGPGRRIAGRGCIPVRNGLDYAAKLLAYRWRGFTFHAHVNGDSWKGYALALAAILLGRLTGKPSVLSVHAGPRQAYFPRERGFWRHAFGLLFRASGRIICDHEPVKQAILRYGISTERVHAISPYSVQYNEDPSKRLPGELEEFLALHRPALLSYTLFRPEFTMEALFEAFARVRELHPGAGLLIAGTDQVPEAARQQLRQLGVSSAVMFTGNLPHAEFLTALQRSDVFVRTHLRDGVCASVLEALTLGVPVVAAEDGHRPASVITYAPGDAQDLSLKLTQVLADLPAVRARVRPPQVENHLDREIALLFAASQPDDVTPGALGTGRASDEAVR